MNRQQPRVWVLALVGVPLLLSACAQAPIGDRGFVQEWSYVGKTLDPFCWYDNVDVKGARDKGATGDGTKVAIVDTGVLSPHEDLPPAHVLDGVEFCSGSEKPDVSDMSGHGTQLAGIVLGRDPMDPSVRRSTRGVAPEAKLIPFKVVCAVAKAVGVARGVQSAIGTSPDVILLALGPWPGDTDANGMDVNQLLDPMVSLNSSILFVVASVWDGTYAKRPDWTKYSNVIVVAGMTLNDAKSGEVPFNDKRGDLWAPAQGVGTASIDLDPKDPTKHAQFLMPGTSAASAIVAGCAALIKEKKAAPGYNGAMLKADLLVAVETQPALPGSGRLKCSKAFP